MSDRDHPLIRLAQRLEERVRESPPDETGRHSLVRNLANDLFDTARNHIDTRNRAAAFEMILRDRLAIGALPTLVRECGHDEEIARRAYEIADMMLRVRQPYVDAMKERDELRERLFNMRATGESPETKEPTEKSNA